LLGKGATGREIRYALLTTRYRETLNFTLESLQSARDSLTRIDDCLTKLREIAGADQGQPDGQVIARFSAAVDEDLNVAGAWGVVFDWVRETNRRLAEKSMDGSGAAAALATWEQIDRVFGVGKRSEVAVPPEIRALLEAREAARKSKDFKRADAARNELKSMGWVIEDTPKGPRLKRL